VLQNLAQFSLWERTQLFQPDQGRVWRGVLLRPAGRQVDKMRPLHSTRRRTASGDGGRASSITGCQPPSARAWGAEAVSG